MALYSNGGASKSTMRAISLAAKRDTDNVLSEVRFLYRPLYLNYMINKEALSTRDLRIYDLADKWDRRFISLAAEVSTWSKDPSTKVGAVLVSPDRTDIAIGYNGFARGMDDSPELYADRNTKYSRIIHGEVNAILLARRSVRGYTAYLWPLLSCNRCTVLLIQAGIARVVAPLPTEDIASRWGEMLTLSRRYYAEAGVSVFEF